MRLISAKTIKDWGRSQAEKYVLLLHETLLQIANNPDIGRNRPELFEKAKSFPAQKHIVYYWQSESGIEIARILHQRMDSFSAFE
ncbi:type II toxin-antitoxin system RelE/ParE family toxin [Alteromonas sp. KUL49]|uniref:type II toxin-antitoxin system RelE/ParE family toxin n=1 Tax=Alteromonas sp. KUL49 TaxID=2480798 RepID=UPI0027D975FD|nr:type II toxin-antitoxin system RelE/ParE family toxin [Alteromonas sp. KUL49]